MIFQLVDNGRSFNRSTDHLYKLDVCMHMQRLISSFYRGIRRKTAMEGMVISNRGQPVVDNQLGTVDEAKVKIYSNPYSRENPEVTLSYSARSILRAPCVV